MAVTQDAVILSDAGHRFGFLHIHRFVFRIGLSIANTFAWIFVLQYFINITSSLSRAFIAVFVMYAIGQVVTIILTPISAAHLRRGTRHSLFFGALVAGGAYITLGATLGGIFNGASMGLASTPVDGPTGWGIAVFAILLGAYRAIYWVPYQLRSSTEEHGRSRLPLVYEALIALMPAFAGITMAVEPFAPLRLLFGSAVLLAVSLLPILPLKDYYERFSWNYGETFAQLLKPRNRRLLSSSFSGGLQGTVLFLIWPIYVFFLVGTNYKVLGAILSVTFFAVLLLRYAYRKLAHKVKFSQSVVVHIVFSMSGWVMRIFVGSPLGVVLADSYSHIGAPRTSHSIDTHTMEQTADNGSFIDEYTALKEIGLAIGRIGACAIAGLLFVLTTPPIALTGMLLIAGISAAVSVYMERTAERNSF
ncbi:MAG: hypothetical protein Q7S01_01260 [bacterium]|nr:hypothetical protein [bacterium]